MLVPTLNTNKTVLKLDTELIAAFAELDGIDAVVVKDDESARDAGERLKRVARCKKAIEAAAKPTKDYLNGLKNDFMAGLNAYLDPLTAKESSLKKKLKDYDAELERRKAEALKAAQEAEAARMPWEDPVEIPETAIAKPILSGVQMRQGVLKARIVDLKAFLEWVLANLDERKHLISPNEPALNAMARNMGEDMKQIVPGVEAYREKTVATR